MTKPQHLCLMALISSAANGLTTLPSSVLQRKPIQTTYSTPSLHYQEDAFVDVEILSHQKLDLIRSRSRPNTTSEMDENGISSTESKSTITHREIRIPMEWYPPQHRQQQHMGDVNRDDPSSCSAYKQKECEQVESTVMVRILKWKKRTGDIVKQGDTMVILEKSQIDSYGRTVEKQRVEVASKDDGVLQKILIHQNEELDLNKHHTRSLLALFHPSLFHSIDIDESTRMDATLLVDEETTTSDRKSSESMNEKEYIESMVTNAVANVTNDMLRGVDAGDSFKNGTSTANKNDPSGELKKIIIGEEDTLPTASNISLEFDQIVEEKGNGTAEYAEVIGGGEEPTMTNATIEQNPCGDAFTAPQEESKEDELAFEELLSTVSNTTCPSSTVSNTTCPSVEQPIGAASNPNTTAAADAAILVGNETADSAFGAEDVAAKGQSMNSSQDVASSIKKQLNDQELDVEWIVDTSAKVVADIMFGGLPTNDLRDENFSSSPDTNLPSKNVEIPKDTSSTTKGTFDHEKPSMYEDENGGQSEIDLPGSEGGWGSQKIEVLDVIVDFFSEAFQKTN